MALTKRFVSQYGEELLKKAPTYFYPEDTDHRILLVDYMGGDPVVARVAIAGHNTSIFPENPNLGDFLSHLVAKGIYEPFKSVQLKVRIGAPISTALVFVYEPTCSVNEYSARYSVLSDSSKLPKKEELLEQFSEERAIGVIDLLEKLRNN